MKVNKKLAPALLLLAVVLLTSCSIDIPWFEKEPQPLAQPLPVDDKPKRMAIGSTSVVGVKADGTVWSWGVGSHGELGTGQAYVEESTPKPIPNMTNFTEVATGGGHFLALRKDGTVWSWGDNRCGQLGYETEPEKHPNPVLGLTGESFSTTPKQIEGLKDIISVAGSSNYSVVLTKNGDVYTFGCNDFGQLGLGYEEKQKIGYGPRYVIPRKVGNVPDAIRAYTDISKFALITRSKNIYIAGSIHSKIDYKRWPITLIDMGFKDAVDFCIDYYDLYVVNERGILHKITIKDYKNNALITDVPIMVNRGGNILNVETSLDGFVALDTNKNIYHLYKGTRVC